MLLRLKNYDELYSTFEWQVPDYYNIASDTVDKDAYKNRTALINILDDGKTENWSFLDIKISANKLANAFDYLKLMQE
jgi:acetyl-CoA synthetase